MDEIHVRLCLSDHVTSLAAAWVPDDTLAYGKGSYVALT